MKKLVLVAALTAALAGCDNAAEEADDTAAVETPTATETAETSAGTYEYQVDGKLTIAVMAPDGTYSDSQDGNVIETGLWEDRDDGKVCFDPEGADTPGICYTVGETGPDGTFVATPEDGGDPLTIKKTG